MFEINQQLTDDLRVLTKTVRITPAKRNNSVNDNIFGESYEVELPNDYVHILNCICEFLDLNPKKKCGNKTTIFQYGANKLDTSQWSSIITNYYMRPSVKQPYYYIINIDDPDDPDYKITIDNKEGSRYGNSHVQKLEIKCGELKNDYKLLNVYIDYLRAPKYIDLTEDDLDEVEDNTAQLEFPDYVIYEIINGIVTLVMENGTDQRLQTFLAVNNSVPAQSSSESKR